MNDVALAGMLLGIILVLYGIYRLLKRYSLKRRCTVSVAGTIVDKDTDGRPSDNEASNAYLEFKYYVNGIEYVKKPMVSACQYNKMERGQNVTVFYDPSNPKRCYVQEIKFRIVLTLLFIVIGVVFIAYALTY